MKLLPTSNFTCRIKLGTQNLQLLSSYTFLKEFKIIEVIQYWQRFYILFAFHMFYEAQLTDDAQVTDC